MKTDSGRARGAEAVSEALATRHTSRAQARRRA
jgi:hypothetical protein